MQITITNGTLTQISETLAASTGYDLPSDIAVTGATKAYNSTTGVVTLTNPTSTMSVTASGDIITYSITTSLTNLTATGATSIDYGGTATVTLTAASGMKLPVSITVSGATSEYDFLTGTITLSEPTGDVSITASALTQEEYFNAVANGLVDTINEKANTSGQKGLDEAWVTAESIETIPTITLTLSQVISQDPLQVQLTSEQIDIIESRQYLEVLNVDVTAFGYQVIPFMTGQTQEFGVAQSYSWDSNHNITKGNIWILFYDETNGTLTLKQGDNLVETSDADATAADIASGKTAYVNGRKITGTGGGASLLDYTVTFSADGSDYYIASCLDGDSITAPTNPTKAGNTFGGWFTEESGAGTEITFPYTPSADVTFYAYFVEAKTATVSGLGSFSPANVTFTKDAGFTVAGIGITEWTDGSGNVFIKIPTLYRKINSVSSNQITSFTISTAAIDNTYQPYSVFVDENGNLLDYVCIGKYWNTSSSSMISSAVGGGTAMTVGNARTLARAVGAGYQQYDWQFNKLWQDLIIIFKETVNTNTGTAWTYDEMGIYWTTSGFWIDGICHNSGVIAVSYNPSKYVDSATTSTDGYFGVSYNLPTTGSGNITKLGYDSAHPFVNYPSAASGSSYTSYYCDAYYYSSGSHPVYSNVGDAFANNGAFRCDASGGWSSAFSVRLCYRPLSA